MHFIVLSMGSNSIQFLCQSTKKIQLLLEVTFDGISKVKESKISFFIHKQQVLKMEEGSVTIVNMYKWFNDIIINLKGLGKIIVKAELN